MGKTFISFNRDGSDKQNHGEFWIQQWLKTPKIEGRKMTIEEGLYMQELKRQNKEYMDKSNKADFREGGK